MLIVVTLAVRGAGVWFEQLRSWPVAVRGGIAAMFTATGVSHFVGMRAELVAMVPSGLPAPELLVSLTGVLELAGAVGVLLARTALLAAAGLTLLLVGLFPANVNAALTHLSTAWEDQLVPRTVLH
jgi:uncharacterized membrane protein